MYHQHAYNAFVSCFSCVVSDDLLILSGPVSAVVSARKITVRLGVNARAKFHDTAILGIWPLVL